ncbi:hypothetical protein AN958_11070 [Leucoagaricus sp. SymC.cos]|nr:hypothetical protein AN958_11070 [Leucoagaricus sp. SymC.cos]
MIHQATREVHIRGLTVSISLTLLVETYFPGYPDLVKLSSLSNDVHDAKPGFRLEYGRSPIRDFGICKGRIRGKSNAVQVWTYKYLDENTSITLTDPDNYYWIYFTTIDGKEIIFDCCNQSFGMVSLVDTSDCVKELPGKFCKALNEWVPTFLWNRGIKNAVHTY